MTQPISPSAQPAISDLLQRALIAHRADDTAGAGALYAQVLALDPGNPDALNLSGVLAAQGGDLVTAIDRLTQAGLARPDSADILYNLGQALRQAKRLEEAEQAYRHVLTLDPDHPSAGLNLANILIDADRAAAALTLIDAQRARHGDNPRLLATMGLAYARLDRPAEAEAACRAAMAANPGIVSAPTNLVDLLNDLDRLDEAEALARATLARHPGQAVLHNNYGRTLVLAGRNKEAEAQFRAALAIDPGYANAHMNLGMALLAQGQFAEGWVEYEWRWRSVLAGHGSRVGTRWNLAAPPSSPVLLFGEQGYGDILQFCRFAPVLAGNGFRVQLAVPGPLLRLLQYSFAPAGVTVFADGGDPYDPDRLAPGSDCPLLSVPFETGMGLGDIPAGRYLHVPAALRARAAGRLRETSPPGTRLTVGLVWSGNPRVENPTSRALSARRSASLAAFAPLAAVPGVALHALQIGPGSEALDAPPFPITDHRPFIGDFLDTAALIEGLDLVISVDTSVVHLAGGLERPVWMLSRMDACWRWLEGRSDTPWYRTLRIWRQRRRGDWDGLIAEVAAELARQ